MGLERPRAVIPRFQATGESQPFGTVPPQHRPTVMAWCYGITAPSWETTGTPFNHCATASQWIDSEVARGRDASALTTAIP